MPNYKLQFLTSSDSIATTKEFESVDDDLAIGHALQLGDGRKLELWLGDELIARMFLLPDDASKQET